MEYKCKKRGSPLSKEWESKQNEKSKSHLYVHNNKRQEAQTLRLVKVS